MQQCEVLHWVRRSCIRLRPWGICGLGTRFTRKIQGVNWGLYEGMYGAGVYSESFGTTIGVAKSSSCVTANYYTLLVILLVKLLCGYYRY